MRVALLVVVAAVSASGCFHAEPGPKPSVGHVTSVSFTSAPSSGEAGSTVPVCWRVEGSGRIPHVAIHTDTVSRAGQGFAAYTGTTFYQDNRTSQSEVGLPGTFCTGVTLPSTVPASGKLYLRAHALDTGSGIVSEEEKAVTVVEAGLHKATSVAFTSVPKKAAANSTATVCWRVEGKGTVPHTAVHWDTATRNVTNATFAAYVKGARYPDNGTEGPKAIPATFCTGIPVPLAGKVYARAHVIDADGPPGRLSTREAVIDIVGKASSVTFDSTLLPAYTKATNVTVCWRVAGEGVVPHTAIHTDTASHAGGAAAFTDYAGAAFYPDNATAARPVQIPGRFCTNVLTPNQTGSFYLRAHVLDVAGGNGILSTEEKSLLVV